MSESSPRERFAQAQERLLAEYDRDITSEFAEIGTPVETVHYLHTEGDGRPVVMLPGVASPAALFVPLLAAVDDIGPMYALERPGRGLSDPYYHSKGDVRPFTVELLDGFLEAIEADSVDIIASSFGGFQAFAYALDRRSKVERISFVGSPAGLSKSLPVPFRLLGVKVINRLMFRLVAPESIEDVRDSMATMNVEDPADLSDELLEVILRNGQIPEHAKSLKTLFETTAGLRGVSEYMLVRDELDRLELPMQFLWGSEDYFYEPTVGEDLLGHRDNVEFEELEGLGHTPWLEPENEVASGIESFLGD